jgi:hypothetical protein
MVIDVEAFVVSLPIAGVVFCWVVWMYRKPSRKETGPSMAASQAEPATLAAVAAE